MGECGGGELTGLCIPCVIRMSLGEVLRLSHREAPCHVARPLCLCAAVQSRRTQLESEPTRYLFCLETAIELFKMSLEVCGLHRMPLGGERMQFTRQCVPGGGGGASRIRRSDVGGPKRWGRATGTPGRGAGGGAFMGPVLMPP